MKKLNFKAVIVFGLLSAAGISLAMMSASITSGAEQIAIASVGSAIFAGSLAFFLIEMFQWDRERNTNK
jgi:hypothetical protein